MRILLVESNAIVRGALKEALELHDFDVVEARDGREALSMIQGGTESFDLVINELVMPGMNALELYEALEQVQGSVSMLIVTGYPMPFSGQAIADQPGVSWVQKPVRFQELGTLARGLLQVEQEEQE